MTRKSDPKEKVDIDFQATTLSSNLKMIDMYDSKTPQSKNKRNSLNRVQDGHEETIDPCNSP